MKRNGFIVIIVLTMLVSLSFMLYNNILRFNYNNVVEIKLKNELMNVNLDRNLDSVKTLVMRLESLKQYDVISEVSNQKIFQLDLDMKYGKDVSFIIHLDHDFSELYITDMQNGVNYLLDDHMVELIYMLDSFDDIYSYQKPEFHKLYYNGEEIATTTENLWRYMKGDMLWYESSIGNDIEIAQVKLTKTDDIFTFSHIEEPSSTNLVVKFENEIVFDSNLESGFYIPEKNGFYAYELTSKWIGDNYNGSHRSIFLVECAYTPEFTISKEVIELGEYTTIIARNVFNPELLYIRQNIKDTVSFIRNGDYYECIIPATYYTELGIHKIEYGLKGYSEMTKEIEVVDRKFSIQYLTVSKSIESSTRTSEAYDQYNKYYKPALQKNVYEAEQDLTEHSEFILPVNGRLSTEFGEERYVNGTPTSYHHAGFDIAAERGTEVAATYKGEVVLAMELILTGNSVVVNHGNGIFSTYFHLDEFYVTEGELIETGQLVGTVGSTGFSTGPHLHFSISFYNMNLEPGYFLFGQRVTYDNYRALFNNQ